MPPVLSKPVAGGSFDPQVAATPAGGQAEVAADQHEPFEPGQLGSNTPKAAARRGSTTLLWNVVKRLRGKDGRALALLLKDYTHVCTAPRDSDGKPCNVPLKLTKPNGTWITTVANRHVENDEQHQQHPISVAKRQKKETEHNDLVGQ